ncbi:hypothetical protein ACROAE_19105 [Shewanella sp. MF05960]|uniref:hypothetical protein n=1 Tax=Shewanella sp. MF05960 TaxID=3434874 RepID=UPI003D7A94A2
MYIFFYTLLIVLVGLGNKAFQSMSGGYDISNFLSDLPLIIFTYFGLIAIWGRAKDKSYFSKKFWRIYFCSILLSILAIPFFETNTLNMIKEFGIVQALVSYIVMSLIMAPYYWGLYSYSFSSNRIWKNA